VTEKNASTGEAEAGALPDPHVNENRNRVKETDRGRESGTKPRAMSGSSVRRETGIVVLGKKTSCFD
jgi:hypothetical protein